MNASENTKEIIRNEIKMIHARIKDTRELYVELVSLCDNLHNKLIALEIEDGLLREMIFESP